MKSALLLGAVVALGVMLLFYRGRLKLAIKVGALLYIALLGLRFLFAGDDPDRFTDLALLVGALGAIWLLADLLTRFVRRRRERRRGR